MSTKGEEVGTVRRLFRYPVKSMAGEEVAATAADAAV